MPIRQHLQPFLPVLVLIGLELLAIVIYFGLYTGIRKSIATYIPVAIEIRHGLKRNPEETEVGISYYRESISKHQNYGEEVDYDKRRDLAENLKDAIVQSYIQTASETLTANSNHSFLQFSCDQSGLCGGFGDRVRGAVSCFYLAYASGRIFNVNWTRYSHLEDYFKINSYFYNISNTSYMKMLKSRDTSDDIVKHFIDSGKELDFLKWIITPTWLNNISSSRMVSIYSNSLAGVEGSLSNPRFKQIFDNLTSSLQTEPIDMSVFVSAALRIIFGNPAEKLRNAFERCIIPAVGKELWDKSIKIGIQIRTSLDWTAGDFTRIRSEKLHCFVEKTMELSKRFRNNMPVVVFVTGDDMNSTKRVMEDLRTEKLTVFSDFDYCDKLRLQHIDKKAGGNWWRDADPYLAWLTLTKMDYLVISRSGFSETASYFSLRPTYRLSGRKGLLSKCNFDNFNLIGSHVHME